MHGQPEFKTLKKYMPEGTNIMNLSHFMDQTFNGRLNEDKIKAIRDKWKGNLVIKGLSSLQDTKHLLI